MNAEIGAACLAKAPGVVDGSGRMAIRPGSSKRRLARAMVMALVTALAGCATPPDRDRVESDAPAWKQPAGAELGRGQASWYGPGFHGKRTASGERFDMNGLTAAHRTLPFGTRVRVRNIENGREVVVRINDRGPHIKDRIIDLSKAAAAELDFLQAGEAPVVLVEL